MNIGIDQLTQTLEREKSRLNNFMATGKLGEHTTLVTVGKLNGLDFALAECRKLISK